jgi:choline kinase
MRVIIVAAGTGSRLWNNTKKDLPKTLLPFGNHTILCEIMNNFSRLDLRDFIIVVGYRAEKLKQYLRDNSNFGYNISLVENPDWQKGNGISVLVAEQETGAENFILSMSDHLVSRSALQRIIQAKSSKNLLLVDPDIDRIFDLEDATKVECRENKIVNIGKTITHYNGIDCGIFRLKPNFFISMRKQLKQNKDSISAAINGLIARDDMEAVFTDINDFWIDIDTPTAYDHALKYYQKK